MEQYKIDMKEYPFPVLITKSILYKLIQWIEKHQKIVLKVKGEALVETQYMKYLLMVFRSNQEFFLTFQIPSADLPEAEVIYRLFADQFQMLTIDGSRCFDQVKVKKRYLGIRYDFKCSAEFYQVCQEHSEELDLSFFA